jgi:hypothetical protein
MFDSESVPLPISSDPHVPVWSNDIMPGFHELLFSVEGGAFAVVSLSLAYPVFALSRIMAFRTQHLPAGPDSPGIRTEAHSWARCRARTEPVLIL